MSMEKAEKSLLIKRILCLVLLVLIVAFSVTMSVKFGPKIWALVKQTDKFKAWIDSFGAWSGIVFVGIRAVQTVVKIVPAEPLEIGSGLAFGAVGGMLLCLLGNILGSIVILLLTRKLGTKVLELFHLDKKLQSMKFLQNKEKRRAILFLFYIIPGTPKDGITYFVGLTDINLVEFMVMTSFARIPSIISSTICGAYLGEKNLPIAIGVFAATAVLSVIGGFVYKKVSARYAQKKEEQE